MSLSASELASAVRYNNARAERTGWLLYYEQVLAELGFHNMSPGPEQFAMAVADWQTRHRPLDDDGKLGPGTWRRMQSALGLPSGGPAPGSISEPLRLAGAGLIWLQIARAEMYRWDTEISGMTAAQRRIAEFHMSRDEEYFMASPYFGGQVKDPGVLPRNQSRLDWCAAFVNWCLHRAGYSHSGSAGAESFRIRRLWRFRALDEPQQGCVAVVGNGESAAHVAFLDSWSNLPSSPGGHVPIAGVRGRQISILGGNQGQRITVKDERRRLLSARDEYGNVSPYLWPEQGAPNCNHIAPTEGPHFCGNIHTT